MTCAEAKQLPILEVCDKLGAKPAFVSVSKGYALFHAPYREDRHPSLKLCLKTNRWTDLATGQFGDVIDLVKETMTMTTSAALAFLAGGVTPCKPFAPIKKRKSLADDLVIRPLEHPALIAYAKSRGISADIAKRFCREAHGVSPQGRPYFAIAFGSNSGGWELRNKAFKRCCGPKDITTLGDGSCVSFFEGCFDFLSHVQLYGYQDNMVYVVLNSTAMTLKAITYVESFPVLHRLELWLDHDKAGREATLAIVASIPQAKDMSYIYSQQKDFNEYIEQIHKAEFVTA